MREIEIEGKPAVALFDSGAYNSYARRRLLIGAPTLPVRRPFRVALGGRDVEVKESCLANGSIEGLDFSGEFVPVDELGRADGHDLDVIIGALVMEKWEIKLDPKSGTLDLEGLRRREFTEF
jgi:hypothetical protein